MPLGERINNTEKTVFVDPRNFEINKSEVNDIKNRVKLEDNAFFQAEKPKYSFSEVILNADTYNSIQDVLAIYDKRELIFEQWGLSSTHRQQNKAGINLYGPSGTGKTMAANAIAQQLDRCLIKVDYSQIESKYVGETSKNLNALFNYAKETKSIIFFDEADALLSKRVTDMSNSTDVSVNQTRSVLLLLINDYDDMIIFATNFIANYDQAFMRRILAHIKFDFPDKENRLKLWKHYIPEKMPTDVDLEKLSVEYSGITGSDISNAVFTAALRAARNGESVVRHHYFEDAIDRIIKSKTENSNMPFTKKTVSQDYVKSQFGGVLPK